MAAHPGLPGQLRKLTLAACWLVASAAGVGQPLTLDPTFGTGGIMIDTATHIKLGYAVLLQSDGRTLIAGIRFMSMQPIAVARYLSNGSPDPTFTAPTLPLDWIRGMALQDDGRSLLVGHSNFEVFTVVRLLEDGAPDSSFGGDGVVTTAFGTTDVAYAVAVQPDDKIVVSGFSDSRAVVVRYLTDGTPDPSFGTGGTVVIPGIEPGFGSTRVLIDSQGRIVMNGRRHLVRLLSGGAPDPGFGTMGVLELGSNYDGNSIARAADDAVLVVGSAAAPTSVVLERYTSAGVLDAGFGNAGQVRFGGTTGLLPHGWMAVVLPDGRFYVGAESGAAFFLGRFLEDGSVDATFGPGGFLLTRVGGVGVPLDLAVQSDGAVVQAGHASSSAFAMVPAIVRYAACAPPSQPPPTVLSVQPAEASAGGGSIVQITGTDLQPGAEVRAGDVDAIVLDFTPPGTLEAELRPVPMGFADVVVRNPDCQHAALATSIFFHPFDVPPVDIYYPFVRRMVVNEVTGGCTLYEYCPVAPVARAQMAVFLLRSKEGATYQPPPATGTVFADVPIDGFAAAWIEELAERGITAGCAVNLYCPDDANTRAEMAVFLLVTLEGTGYQPPDATGVFTDVPVSSPFARWIEELSGRGITAGCGPGLYCPNNPVLREQMAVFLSVTFNLPG